MSKHRQILIYLVMSILFLAGCHKKEAEATRVYKAKASPRKVSPQLDKQELESLLKELKQKNPFRPDHVSGIISEVKGSTELRGIIWDSRRPFALIGDRVIVEGDSIDGKKVLKINKDSVILDNKGTEEILKLELTSQ